MCLFRRCRLRKKKEDALTRCYFNEEIWNEDIGQGWEMVVLDLKDRCELELSKTKRLMFVNHVEEHGSSQRLISEMEFVVDIASTASANTQLATEVSIPNSFIILNSINIKIYIIFI